MTREAGFTLIELLVALALMALLSAMLLGGLRVTHRALDRSEAANRQLDRVALAFGVIRREIESADPLLVAPLTGVPRIAFSGTADAVSFIAPPAAYLALGGAQVTSIAIERGNGGRRVVLRYRPLGSGDLWPPAAQGGGQSVVLLDGLPGASLAYFGSADGEADPHWLASWTDPAALPLLVRLRLGGVWPDLVAEPRLGKIAATGWLGSRRICPRGVSSVFCP